MTAHDHHHSNQGSCSIETVLAEVPIQVLTRIAAVVRKEVANHRGAGDFQDSGTCECPAVEALCSLYDQGFKVVRQPDPEPWQ